MKLKLILNNSVRLLALTLLASTTNACPTPDSALSGTPGVLIMAHGGSDQWNQAVEQVIAPLKNQYPIEIAYGMAKTSTLQAAVNRLESQGVNNIAVVRMFISGKSFLEKTEHILGLSNPSDNQSPMNMNNMDNMNKMDMPNKPDKSDSPDKHTTPTTTPTPPMNTTGMAGMAGMAGMEPATPIKSHSTFTLSKEGVSTSRLIDDILIERVQALSTDPSNEALLILAHGPGSDEENKQWLIDMERRTKKLNSLGQFADIQCETLREDWPGRRAQAEARIKDFVQSHNDAGIRVIVIPFRVAGFGPYQEVLQGLTYTADHLGFSPHPNMTTWIDQTARSLLPHLPTSQPTSTRITTQPTQPVNDN